MRGWVIRRIWNRTSRAASLMVLIAALPARADVVELQNGQRVEGTLKQATPTSVSVEVGGQTITFEGEKVRAIYFGAAPAIQVQPSAMDEAMKALKGLRSVAQGGITYRDYVPRVSDAKIVVDRYLQEPDASPVKTSISEAMQFYVFAGAVWNAKITSQPGIGAHPMVERCPALREKVSGTPVTGNMWTHSCPN